MDTCTPAVTVQIILSQHLTLSAGVVACLADLQFIEMMTHHSLAEAQGMSVGYIRLSVSYRSDLH